MTATINTTYPFTCADGTLNGAPIPADYMAEAELARQAADMSGALDAQAWRTLLAAIRTGLPVVLTRRDRANSGREVRETITTIVKYACVSPGQGSIRLSYWGFGHEQHVSQIVAVGTPDTSYVTILDA